MKDGVIRYLTTLLGCPVEIGVMTDAERRRVGWLVNFYDLCVATLAGRRHVLAFAKSGLRYTPAAVAKQFAAFQSSLNAPLVFVPRVLAPHDVPRLIAARVPFVAPNRGLFLPDVGFSVARPASAPVTRETFSVSAQLLVCGYLLKKWDGRMTLAEAAKRTGFSHASIVHAFQEIVYFGAGDRLGATNDRQAVVQFRTSREIWESCRGRFFNPCKRTIGASTCPQEAVLAGVDALSEMSELNGDIPTTFALPAKGFRSLGLEVLSTDEAPYRLQLWYYPPTFFGDMVIDPISLALSLRDNPDDRVQIQLRKLEESFI